MNSETAKTPKSFLVKILQWFYLLLAVFCFSGIFLLPQITSIEAFGFPQEVIVIVFVSLAIYCLILSLSFFFSKTNLLILSLVLIFFTTLAALILLVVAIPNAGHVLSGDLPACAKNLATCDLKEGIIVASAALLAVAIPTLILNLITIIGAMKAIGEAS